MTSVLEKPDLDSPSSDEDLVHRCCFKCWPLPGAAMAYCGVWKEYTQVVRCKPDQVCKTCKDPAVVRSHKCSPI